MTSAPEEELSISRSASLVSRIYPSYSSRDTADRAQVATQNNGGDYYDMTIRPDDGGEERWVGFCSRVRGGDDYECNAGLTGSSGVHAFNCYPEQETLSLYYP